MKKGLSTFETAGVLILGVIFLWGAISLFSNLAKPGFTLGVQEQVCRFSLALSNTVLPGIKPICGTLVVPLTKKVLEKQVKDQESLSDTGSRIILEHMQRCKDTFHGAKSKGFFSSKTCYICYSLHTDSTFKDVMITEKALDKYALTHREPNGKTYFTNLRQQGQYVILALDGPLRPNRHYGIIYASTSEGYGWVSAALGTGAGVGICVLGLYTGPLAPFVCGIGLHVAGGGAVGSFFQSFSLGPEEGAILLTSYSNLQKQGCDDIVS